MGTVSRLPKECNECIETGSVWLHQWHTTRYPFWCEFQAILVVHIYSQRNERTGAASIKLHTDSQAKAEILNRQFVSVPTTDTVASSTSWYGPSYPPIRGLQSYQFIRCGEAVGRNINPNMAADPNQTLCRFLKEMFIELAPVLTAIFQQSLETGVLPSVWLTAYVSPIFKKGSQCLPENYQPVSLNCTPVNF